MLSALRPGMGPLGVTGWATVEKSLAHPARIFNGVASTISPWASTSRLPASSFRCASTRSATLLAQSPSAARLAPIAPQPHKVCDAVARRFSSSDSKRSDKEKSATERKVTEVARKAAELLGQSKVAGPLGAKAAQFAQQKLAERQEKAEASPFSDSTTKAVPPASSSSDPTSKTVAPAQLSEDILTIPNVLTIARLLSTPFIGYLVIQDQMVPACTLLFVSGLTDVLDGWIARRSGKFTVFGSIADPAADKALMTTMVIALAWRGLLPAPLVALIIGRDVALVISAFFIRYRSLPEPKTFARYWDPRLPSASVQPTQISKYNTFLQLVLVGTATLLPILPEAWQTSPGLQTAWQAYMGIVALTTIWSGASYVFGTGGFKHLGQKAKEVAKAGVANRTGGGGQ